MSLQHKNLSHSGKALAALRNFTLVELLIVIVIITILCSLLLPALASARNTGQKVSCAARLKQMGQSICMYGGDYQDQPPTGGWAYPVTSPFPTDVRWPVLVNLYIDNIKLFTCPSAADRDAPPGQKERLWEITLIMPG